MSDHSATVRVAIDNALQLRNCTNLDYYAVYDNKLVNKELSLESAGVCNNSTISTISVRPRIRGG